MLIKYFKLPDGSGATPRGLCIEGSTTFESSLNTIYSILMLNNYLYNLYLNLNYFYV